MVNAAITQPIIIAGSSHAACLGVPLTVEPESGPLLKIDSDFEAVTGNFPRDDEYWERTVQFAEGRAVVVVWNGNQHYGRFLLQENPPFDFVVPCQQELPLNPGSILVPYTAIKEIWRDTLIGLEDLVKRLASIDGCRAFILGTPPPVRDPASIQAALEQRDDLFVRQSLYYDIDLETARLTPRSVMWKLWASIQDAMAEVAKTYGAEFIPVP
jgi:hypothetical protein